MRISNDGIALIKRFEGLELEAYRDAVGILTIGYGHTGDDVYEGQVINEAEAEAILRRDLDRFEVAVNEGIKAPTAQSMFDAFVSLSFNIGSGAFKKSTALKRHNKRDYVGASEAITWWNKAGGNVLTGLVRRRAAEEALYLEGLGDVTDDNPTASAGIEENSPRRSNPVSSRTTAGAGTAGAAGATGAGAVLLDDDEKDDAADDGTTTDTGTTDTGTTDSGTSDSGTTDTGSTDTDTDTADTDTGDTDVGDTGTPDDMTDTGDGDTEDAGDSDTGTTGDEDADSGTDTADETVDETAAETTTGDDDTGTETTESTADDGGTMMEKLTPEDRTEAIVLIAGVVAVLAAIFVIFSRIDDWFKYRR
ncbi:lysozyme [Parvularcula marina]|uniref:Lysozyme n=1 Tax=Parvularcula marina TaxID=2292771 RepID=A0A371R7Q5_9PROT|nr:lysozyme [Parvularcula marina]RFB01473.1 lysozyme [Parvularcula marina]